MTGKSMGGGTGVRHRLRSGVLGLAAAAGIARDSETHRGRGLSSKLLYLTLLFVMLAEVLIFVPSVANFRVSWLNDRLTAAQLASLASEAVPGGNVPDSLRDELLRTAQVSGLAVKRNDQRRLVMPPNGAGTIEASYDLRVNDTAGWFTEIGQRLTLIYDAIAVFFTDDQRIIRVVGQPGLQGGDFVEIMLPVGPLKTAMIRYGLNVLALSVIISVITAALVYFALNTLLVQPMTRITHNMLDFAKNPEDASRIIAPSDRSDEIGTAERELAHMQTELNQLLAQKNRLAQLGLAVSKINHDLRNMLASAQLLSDRMTSIPDPSVQRFAPKLIASLDRAIALCNNTLQFGRAAETPPKRELIALDPVVREVADGLGLPKPGTVALQVAIDPALRVDADRDHLYRVLNNICRNAVQALEQMQGTTVGEIVIAARRDARTVTIDVSDNGPGVPAQARQALFKAFQGSTRKGGSGLGLAIAHELVTAHGGTIALVDSAEGAAFRVEIPDRTV
jgi:signal transduction histidine kinase